MKNRVQLIGNLGATPEVKTFNGNGKVARVSLATNESYKNAKGEYVKETTWHNIVLWGSKAESAGKLFQKGMEVLISGKIVNRSYEDKDGIKRYVSEIQADEFMLLGNKPEQK